MIQPKLRPIAAGVACFIALAPIVTLGALHGKTQGVKNTAEIDRQERLTAVAKAFVADNCYQSEAITVGAEFPVKGRSQSVCVRIKDGSRFGFLEYQKATLTITDAFSNKEVQAKISTLGVKTK